MQYSLILNSRRSFIGLVTIVLLAACPVAIAAGPRFSNLLHDHAVLQRGVPVTIRGSAKRGRRVTVTFAGQTKNAVANEAGEWSVVLDAMPANANGQALSCKENGGKGHSVALRNVVVGEVFLFARQTSVDISLGRTKTGRDVAAKVAPNPALRVMRITTIPSLAPQSDLDAQATTGWAMVDKDTAGAMSAAAFHFGRDLVAEVDVPVGIIDLDLGSNFTIGWISREDIANNDAFYDRETRVTGYGELMEDQVRKYKAQEGKEGRPGDIKWIWEHPVKDPMYPAAGYNAVLHPMRGLAMKGILLQLGNDYPYMAYERLRRQGRSFDRDALDVAWWRNYTHRKQGFRAGLEVIPRLPTLWRSYLGNKDLPVGLIMPPNSDHPTYAIHNRETREVQRRTAEANVGVGLILPGEQHIPFSGQPADDVLLAKRSLAWALGAVYKRDGVAASGPLFDRVVLNYADAQIFFKEGTADGLKASPGALAHFQAAGVDNVFSPAKAEIDGNTIRLTSNTVNRIAHVSYNYSSQPQQGLTNSAGLHAIPFRTGEHKYIDTPRNTESSLPPEYSTPAGEWKSGGVAIISGGGEEYSNGPGWLGATGLRVLPFGPNMRVTTVLPGSPADGVIEVGDMIYKANGQLLEDDHLPHLGRAIAYAESRAGGGKVSFALRRGDKLHDVTLTVEVLGSYSPTSPYDCPKADRIIANSEAYLAKRGGLATGYAGGGWLYSDIFFLLGAGTPEHQGLVRRFIYSKMAEIDRSEKKEPGRNSRCLGHGTLLFSEYYLATGDRNVLPYLRCYSDTFTSMQCRPGAFGQMPPRSIGGWRHNYPGGQTYGMIPSIGLPGMIGLNLAKEAGVKINDGAYRLGLRFFRDGQAEMGYTTYAAIVPDKKAPESIDPEKLAAGMLYSRNGCRAKAAILFALEGDTRIAHLNSLYTAFAYNNCHEGHGSNFFNGLWTPLGASLHSEAAFINFMSKHYWYRDLKRMYNHVSFPANTAPSVGHDLALVVPRQRLRILGAPRSVFAANAPAQLKPALTAYYAKDYTRAEQLVDALLAGGQLPGAMRPQAAQLQRAVRELRESIARDIAKIERLVKAGKPYEAGLDLPQLKALTPQGDRRLVALQQALTAADAKLVESDRRRYHDLQKSLAFDGGKAKATPGAEEGWKGLTTVSLLNRRARVTTGSTDEDQVSRWRVKPVEAITQAPERWQNEKFDDSGWGETTLPISWSLNHTFLGRTDFEVDDPKAIKALRVSCTPYRQLNVVVYINGHIVAKFNNCENVSGWVQGELPPTAIKHLKKGRNTFAFSTTHDWRWSSRSGVRNGGFGLTLNAK